MILPTVMVTTRHRKKVEIVHTEEVKKFSICIQTTGIILFTGSEKLCGEEVTCYMLNI